MKISVEQKVRMVLSKYDSKSGEAVWHQYAYPTMHNHADLKII